MRSAVAAAAIIGAGIIVASGSAIAQTETEVTVTAPRTVHETVGRYAGASSAPMEQVSLSRGVSYADLDLTKDEGMTELENRIKDAADGICKKLELAVPRSGQRHFLRKKASDDAMKQAHEVAAAARK